MLDFDNNTTARNLNVLIADSAQTVRQEALDHMASPSFVSRPAPSVATSDALRATSNENMTPNPLAAILKTAMESSDLTVSDIAAQAARQQQTLTENQTVNLRNPN